MVTMEQATVERMIKEVAGFVREMEHQPNMSHPTPEELRQTAERNGIRTEFGNYVFMSMIRNRSAGLTVYIGSPNVMLPNPSEKQKEIIKNTPKTIESVHEYLRKAPLICVKRTMCTNPYFTPNCTMFLSVQRKDSTRIAYMWSTLLFDSKKGKGPDFYLIYVPEWHEKDRQILVFPEIGVTYVLGTDYLGEAKKAFLRLAMWYAKQKGMLGLHAGAKILRARDETGKIRRYGALLFGLSGTGKTTHTCHDHGLNDEGEGVEIVQDDVVFLRPDGSALGPERGFFLKTDIDPLNHPLIHNAATKRDAVFENVMVDHRGKVYFLDETLTGNGRGVIQRADLGDEHVCPSIDLPPIDELDGMIILFITRRNTVVPIASKLTHEQAAAAFTLGESIETTASDPRRAGESVRVVGTNPFIIGDEAEEGNMFYEFLKRHGDKIQCYLINTGGVGEIREESEEGIKVVKQKVTRVEIPEMAAIIRGIARGDIEWEDEPYFGTKVPKNVEGMDMTKFDLAKFYSQKQIDAYVSQLRRERMEYIERFPGLDAAIIGAIKR
ncbi:MAG: phosphoenolpyruvate carboxykinase [Methanocellales archaeon]|nr:phosphoenolpyruvate carboxykinase [Methanocellales archaeon]